ncbi:hypothetical protein Ahy_B02g061221 [Arachis hypogaea]|uniref:SWIM-type domain-containing protein n=1 Tax=Arachis hypogaea TaxID=3818 RepID=A0A445AKF1_ARAHY|nr:hypothetical protein Ahy_B02g061221 [Arachis hypogaea]
MWSLRFQLYHCNPSDTAPGTIIVPRQLSGFHWRLKFLHSEDIKIRSHFVVRLLLRQKQEVLPLVKPTKPIKTTQNTKTDKTNKSKQPNKSSISRRPCTRSATRGFQSKVFNIEIPFEVSSDSYESVEDSLFKPNLNEDSSFESNTGVKNVNSGSRSRVKNVGPLAKGKEKILVEDDAFVQEVSDKEVEVVRMFVMQTIVKNKVKLNNHIGVLTPVIKSRLEKVRKESKNWKPIWTGHNGYEKFEVHGHPTNHVVDLGKRLCTCQFWMLTGIPCVHACVALP